MLKLFAKIILFIIINDFIGKIIATGFNDKNVLFKQIKPKVSDSIQTLTVQELVKRIIPNRVDEFEVKVDSELYGDDYQDIFIIQKNQTNNKVYIKGSSGIAAASGFNYYLKYYCNSLISWQTQQLSVPDTLPIVNIKIKTNNRLRYYQNVCTVSYSFAWWNWTQWEQHIDWMALNGINLPLAFTGQEAIWDRVYREYYNLTDSEIDEHFTGPAFFAWGRMGNIRGFGGPLTKSWHQMTIKLQKRILKRMRDFGMTPVLPAFAGHVPRAFKRIFPNAKLIPGTHWGAFEDQYCCPYLVDPTDPLFKEIGTIFIKYLIAEFGTDHIYNCDTFNEMTPNNSSEVFLSNFGKTIIEAMKDADSDAIWLMQGWFLYNSRNFWTYDRAKALLTAVPKGQLIMLDLMSEEYPQYERFDSYFGHYFVWCMLHNFGGKLGMFGSIDKINQEIFKPRSENGSTMIGIGLTMEGINQNYVVYDFMADMFWKNESINLVEWFANYAHRRYGQQNEHSSKAWQILKSTIYNSTKTWQFMSDYIISSRPRRGSVLYQWYNFCDFMKAWNELVAAGPQLETSDSYRYDLVDVTRQSLQNLVDQYYLQLMDAFNQKNIAQFQSLMIKFLNIFDDLEMLLNSNESFMLGNWLESAKSLAVNTEAYPGQFEYNARNQVTLWGPHGEILDYAIKHWSGIVIDYFKPRWTIFLSALNTSLVENTVFNDSQVQQHMFNEVEEPFTRSQKLYSNKAIGDSVKIATYIYDKWSKEMNCSNTARIR